MFPQNTAWRQKVQTLCIQNVKIKRFPQLLWVSSRLVGGRQPHRIPAGCIQSLLIVFHFLPKKKKIAFPSFCIILINKQEKQHTTAKTFTLTDRSISPASG